MSEQHRSRCDAALDGDRSAATLEHLARCPECARRLAAVDAAAAALRRQLPSPPAGLDARVLGSLGEACEGDPRTRRRLPHTSSGPGRGRGRHGKPARTRGRLRPLLLTSAALVAVACAFVIPGLPSSHDAPAVAIVPLRADCRGAAGDTSAERLVVAGPWSGPQAERFSAVLSRFEQRTGIPVTYAYETRPMADKLEARIRAGCPPDVALLPQPGVVRDLAERGRLQPLDAVLGEAADDVAPAWRALTTIAGRSYGLWFKATNKSMVWYRPDVLRSAGVTSPATTWSGMLRDARQLRAVGIEPFALAGAEGWTLTDLFENLYLHGAGPRRYDQLAGHRIPWTHPSVKATLRRMASLFASPALIGAPRQALERTVRVAVDDVLGPQGPAGLLLAGDYVLGTLSPDERADARGEIDFVPFPAVRPGTRGDVLVGGDAAVLFNDTPAAKRLIRWLASAAAAEPWAAAGGLVSPNRGIPSAAHEPLTARAARRIADADVVRFDLSDLQPPAFGSAPDRGLQGLLRELLRRPTAVDEIARQLEASARRAHRR